jgi:outer membrane protein OmpA-like peptidoglycan-associated protein
MKTFILIFVVALFFIYPPTLKSQEEVKKKIEDKTKQRADERTDDAIEEGMNEIEEGVISIFKKKDKPKKSEKVEDSESKSDVDDDKPTSIKTKSEQSDKESLTQQPTLKWSKYDFVPGGQIIFEDNQENEQNGEFPSRWDHAGGGSVEIASFGNDPVIYFKDESSFIIPFIKNREKDYLPEIFTIEFDAYFEKEEYCIYHILLYDIKNQTELDLSPIVISANHIKIYQVGEGFYPGATEEETFDISFWRHIALSFNKRALKIYLDDARVLNIPNITENPTGLTAGVSGYNIVGIQGTNRFIKNVKIAQGGVKLYDKFLIDGKIVTTGIKFDVNKATLRPESMGVINSIFQLMKEHPEIKFSVEGHTDSDGDDASNQTLSERRAKAVVEQLVNFGIAPGRLTSNGWGESKPFESNTTPEAKANNRRVEFVKM